MPVLRSFKLCFKIWCVIQLLSSNGLMNNRTNLSVIALMSESRELMSGKVLRLIVIHFPPALSITKGPNGTEIYSGTSLNVIKFVGASLNISFEYVRVPDEDIVKYGIGPAQINLIVNDKADVLVWGLVLSHARFLITDPSTCTLIEPFRLVVPWPKEESRLLAPIRPFQPLVWLFLGLTIVVLAPVLVALSNLYMRFIGRYSNNSAARRYIRRPIVDFANLLHNFSFLLSHITNQGYRYDLRLKSRGSYLLVGIWCLMAVVLANAYGGVLFSFLSVSKLEPVLNSMEEVAQSKDVQMLTQDRTELAIRLLGATSGYEKVIGDSLRSNPENLVSNLKQVKTKLKTGSYAFPYLDLYLSGLVDAIYRENGKKCGVTYAKEPVSQFSPVSMMLAKNGPYTKAINERIQALSDGGILEFNVKNFMPRVDQCKMENQQASAHQKALTLVDMSSAFVVFGLGISFAVLVFLIELVYKRINDRYFTGK